MCKQYLGVDIGGTAVKLGLVTEQGRILHTDSAPVDFDHYCTPMIETALKFMEVFLAKHHIPPEELNGIGVSATGQIDIHRGVVAGTAGHIRNWQGTPIVSFIQDRFHRPAAAANDADCAVIGEHWLGAAKDDTDVVMITLGTGIGGGIITNNRLLSGVSGIAGELGHIPIHFEGEECSCRNRGCYEHYASTTALVRAVTRAFPHLNLPGITQKEINGKLIFDLLPMNSPELSSIVDNWIDAVAAGLIGLIHIFNPGLVLIGGGVSSQEKFFIDPLREKVFQKVMPGFREGLKLESAALGNDAGLLGAVANLKLRMEEKQ